MSKFGFDVSEVKLSLVTASAIEQTPEIGDTLLDYALRYADLGWYVIPVRRDKKPVDGYGLNSATKDPAVIRNIWSQHPNAGIAVACEKSGLVVLDIDPRNGGRETLARLEAEHGVIYSAIASVTQSGGEHRVFKAEPGVSYPGTLGAGLDVKHRGYILVEPSQGESGNYHWQDSKNPLQGALPLDTPAVVRQRTETPYALARVMPASVVVSPDTYLEIEEALKVISAEDYNQWYHILQALKRLSDTEKAYTIAREWSATSPDPEDTLEVFERKWAHDLNEAGPLTYKSILMLADQQDRAWRQRADERLKLKPTVDALASFKLTPLTIEELKTAQLNPRVVLPFMLYADVRTRISAGGTGKTTVALYEAIVLALGRELWGRQPEHPVRTCIVTREDTREILVARAREIMKGLGLGIDEVAQVLSNVMIVDLSGVSFRISAVVGDVVQPHNANLKWLNNLLEDFKPDWLILDPLVSFGVGEQRVNDAEQGLIEAMRILKAEFKCCVEGIHHSGKANAREKTLDQYSGRGGSAMADGARMVCVMQPLEAKEWLDATGEYLEPDSTGIVMAMPKMSYCRAQDPIYVVRKGYTFTQVMPVAQPSQTDVEKQNDIAVFAVIKEAWLRNQPLSFQNLRDDFKALLYGQLTRAQTLESLGRLKRDGQVLQHDTKGGRGNRSGLEPVFVDEAEKSKYAIPG